MDYPRIVYDLQSNPITFDFSNALAVARLVTYANTKQCGFELRILADRWRNRTPRELAYGIGDRIWRLHNLIAPVCSLANCLSAFSIGITPEYRTQTLSDRVDYFSQAYLVKDLVDAYSLARVDPHCFTSPEIARQKAIAILGENKKTAVIPIRLSQFETSRDTSLHLVTDISRRMISDGFNVHLIPDQESVFPDVISDLGINVVYEAAYSLPLRLAMHQQATISICSMGGTTSLALLAEPKPSMVIYHPIRMNVPIASRQYFQANSYNVGNPKPLPWSPDNQVWLWHEDVTAQEIYEVVGTIVGK